MLCLPQPVAGMSSLALNSSDFIQDRAQVQAAFCPLKMESHGLPFGALQSLNLAPDPPHLLLRRFLRLTAA